MIHRKNNKSLFDGTLVHPAGPIDISNTNFIFVDNSEGPPVVMSSKTLDRPPANFFFPKHANGATPLSRFKTAKK